MVVKVTIHSDEGQTLNTSISIETLHSGQFMLSAQLIIPNYPVRQIVIDSWDKVDKEYDWNLK